MLTAVNPSLFFQNRARVLHLFFVSAFIVSGCSNAQTAVTTSGNQGLDLSPPEILLLRKEANGGDKEAAYRLYLYHAFVGGDAKESEFWLQRGVELSHPAATYALGLRLIVDADSIKKAEGLKWLKAAAKLGVGAACGELGRAYMKGVGGPPNFERARQYYVEGAELGSRACWIFLADALGDGTFEPRDYVQAYYWASLEAKCINPRFAAAKKYWALRETYAAKLSLEELEGQWLRIDRFFADMRAKTFNLETTPYPDSLIDPAKVAEARAMDNAREQEHRLALRHKTPD